MADRTRTNQSLKGIFQMAYVARDFDRASDMFAEHYGIAEFGRLGDLELSHESGDTLRIEVGLAWIDEVQIEIIEPRGGRDAIYRDVLDRHPESDIVFHHIGILLPTRQSIEDQRAESLRRGRPIALSGELEGVSAFFYADARATLGHYVEYLYFSPERLAFHKSMPRF